MSNDNIPNNWKEQIKEIIKTLKECNVVNNDMWINNFLVKDDVINLIDFGWASSKPSFPFINIDEDQMIFTSNLFLLLDITYIQNAELRIEFEKSFRK